MGQLLRALSFAFVFLVGCGSSTGGGDAGEADIGPSVDVGVDAGSAASVSGDLRTLVILLNFDNADLVCSTSDVRDLMFDAPDSINEFFREASADRLTVSGDVIGPYRLSFRDDDCIGFDEFPMLLEGIEATIAQYIEYAEEAVMLAEADIVDMESYDRIMFVVPDRADGCINVSAGVPPGPTVGEVGIVWIIGDEAQTPIFGASFCAVRSKYGHEFGHSLGMAHSETPDGEVAAGFNYGDTSDVMGGVLDRKYVMMNAPHRYEMGWYDADEVIDVPPGGGSFEVAPLAAEGSMATKMLRVAGTTPGSHVYVSYRTGASYDGALDVGHQDRVHVHTWAPGEVPWQADAPTQLHARLAAGQSQSVDGVTVEVVAMSGSGTQVTVTSP